MGVLGVAWRTFRSKAFTTRTPGQTMEGARREDGGDMKKVLGAFDLMMLGVGAIIGAGVFVLTGVAARCKAGPSVVLSYLLSSIAAMLAALSYAEFAVEVPVAGGAYVYVSMVFGEFLAW
ncbi:unnamed protein product [Ostreobium quekettii]|uniref:Amino acid permease/ SLC12A domain-containing protein n=1 Tax=Ostreobium quekettii TaxID=121088 RepID=A0A8S1IXV7_9CHLO|nr:unnamed protein product [Ostreobium quekettii]